MKRELLEALLAARKNRQAVALITDLSTGEQRLVPRSEARNDPLADKLDEAFRFDQSGSHEGQFVNIHNPPLRLVIIGAVHIAQSVIPMAQQLGYDVSVIDPRGAFATGARFPGIALHAEWPDEILPQMALDPRTAMIALTHDPKIDDPALFAALKSDVFYTGALGSKKTQASRGQRLKEAGFTEQQIARIHGPIGLDIGAKGAPEIAVSIMAEMTRALRSGNDMIFGELPVADAEGAILAHSVKHPAGLFKKGRVLSADMATLTASDVVSVFAAKLGPDDVPEDEAAAAVARIIGAAGTTAQAPFTGRANLHASVRGLAIVDTERVRALNRLHESLTLATVQPFAIVEEREMVATVKVIPFAVPRGVLARALDIVGTAPLIRVAAFQAKRVGLIITSLPQTKPSIIAKSEDAMRERIAALDGVLAEVRVVPHAIASVTQAIAELRASACDPVLIFGASAIVDRGDVIPSAVTKAGGEVLHLGMPVDPGNLMMLGALGDVPVIGVPSCARSPKLNGFDWVLARLMADVPVRPADIMDMGAGGLLAEIPTRPSPREGKPKPQRAPRVAAVVLAAGQSSRMGSNKLLADVGGVPMVRKTVNAVVDAVDSIVVVTGRDADHITAALRGVPLSFVHNPDYAHGLSTSLRQGLGALPADTDAAVIVLGDMPLVTSDVIRRLIAAYSPAEHRSICVPVHGGERGNPVLWGRQHFDAIKELSGDRGARALFDQYADEVVEVAMPDSAVLTDVDTPEALARLRGEGFVAR